MLKLSPVGCHEDAVCGAEKGDGGAGSEGAGGGLTLAIEMPAMDLMMMHANMSFRL